MGKGGSEIHASRSHGRRDFSSHPERERSNLCFSSTSRGFPYELLFTRNCPWMQDAVTRGSDWFFIFLFLISLPFPLISSEPQRHFLPHLRISALIWLLHCFLLRSCLWKSFCHSLSTREYLKEMIACEVTDRWRRQISYKTLDAHPPFFLSFQVDSFWILCRSFDRILPSCHFIPFLLPFSFFKSDRIGVRMRMRKWYIHFCSVHYCAPFLSLLLFPSAPVVLPVFGSFRLLMIREKFFSTLGLEDRNPNPSIVWVSACLLFRALCVPYPLVSLRWQFPGREDEMWHQIHGLGFRARK